MKLTFAHVKWAAKAVFCFVAVAIAVAAPEILSDPERVKWLELGARVFGISAGVAGGVYAIPNGTKPS